MSAWLSAAQTIINIFIITGLPTWGDRLVTVVGVCRRLSLSVVCRRRLSESVTLAYATQLTREQHATAARDIGPVVLHPVTATPCLIQVRRLYAKHWLKERSNDSDSESAAAGGDGQPHLRIVQSLSGNQGKLVTFTFAVAAELYAENNVVWCNCRVQMTEGKSK